MAPPASTRRRKRVGGRILRGVLSLALVVGFAYLIHRPLVQVFQGATARMQPAGEGPTRLFGGYLTPTITHWLAAQQQQTGAA